MCLRACAECTDTFISACAKFHPSTCCPLTHSEHSMTLLADSVGPDQTARMRSLIRAFAVRICPKTLFRILEFSNCILILAWPHAGIRYISNLTKVKYSSLTIFLHILSPLLVRNSQIREKDIPKDRIYLFIYLFIYFL